MTRLGLERQGTGTASSEREPDGSSLNVAEAGGREAGRDAALIEARATELLRRAEPSREYPILSADQERRRRMRETPLNEELPAPQERKGCLTVSEAESRFEQALARLKAAGLTREERACYLLWETHLWSYREIAQLFGVSYKTAWTRVQNATDKLRPACRRGAAN